MIDWNSFWTTVFAGAIILGIGGLGFIGRMIISILSEIRVDIGKMGAAIRANADIASNWQTTHSDSDTRSFLAVYDQIRAHEELDKNRFETLDTHIGRIDNRIDSVKAA